MAYSDILSVFTQPLLNTSTCQPPRHTRRYRVKDKREGHYKHKKSICKGMGCVTKYDVFIELS